MNQVDKKYVILGSLCALVLMLVVGYAAFSTLLNVKGTSNISSNWDIKITGIEKMSYKGATDNEGSPSYDNTNGLSATFNTDFTTPGDYATYKIEITNNGSLDAKLTNITMPGNTNNNILFYLNKNQTNTDIADTLKQNDTLFKAGETGNVGYVYITVLYRDYDGQITPTKENATVNMTITFDFEQADGNGGTPIKEKAADQLIATEVTTGDGLYLDTYESDENKKRYVYKGANPNNYITFNNETWRIISVETDGTLKIMKKDSIRTKAWDSSNSNNWTRPATLNTYLNDENDSNSYYNTLSTEAKGLIQEHIWGIGSVTNNNTDLAEQIASENGTTWTGKIGLMSASDYLKANTNATQCGNNSLNTTNYSTCKTTNYIFSSVPISGHLWTISPYSSSLDCVFSVYNTGILYSDYVSTSTIGMVPVLYLIPNITLEGKGTSDNPYTIVS